MSLPAAIAGEYEILRQVRGGDAVAVYQARYLPLGEQRTVAVAQLRPATGEDRRQRFRREARSAADWRHPNIARLHEYFLDDGTAGLVTEHVDGSTLEEMLAEDGPPALDLTLEIAAQSLAALDYLHRQGLLHRDLSAADLKLSRGAGGRPLVQLIDLGILRRLAAGGLTRYCSPECYGEQLEGRRGARDRRSDVYSFGVVLYELLTGVSPIRDGNLPELVAALRFDPPRDFAETDPEGRVPEGLRQLVMRALEKDPDRRMASAEELARLLAPFHRAASAAPAPRPTPDRAARGPRWIRAAAAAAAASVIALLVYLASPSPPPPPPTPPPPGVLVIDALPWAEVKSVVDGAGNHHAIESGACTPLRLSLPPGSYRIRLEHPDFPPARELAAEVRPRETTELPVETLGTIDVERYLRDGWQVRGARSELESESSG